MKFYSLNNQAPKTSFKEAVIRGIAPDRGLYFPEKITSLPDGFFETIEARSNSEIAFSAIRQFVSEDIPDNILNEILDSVLDFNFPVVEIEGDVLRDVFQHVEMVRVSPLRESEHHAKARVHLLRLLVGLEGYG